jgi:hypothetical protein
MKTNQPDDYRRGLDFASSLAKFNVEHAPTVPAEMIVRRAVSELQKLYGTSRRLKQAQIVAFIEQNSGNASVPEIVHRYKWNRGLASDLMNEMVDAGILIKYRSETPGTGSRGGRPQQRFRLKNR